MKKLFGIIIAVFLLTSSLAYAGNINLDNSVSEGDNHIIVGNKTADGIKLSEVSVENRQLVHNGSALDRNASLIVSDENDLKNFSDIVSNADFSKRFDFSTYTIYLINDITLADPNVGESNFSPIGTNFETAFNGTFDGQDYKISNIKISADVQHAGFFGFVGSEGIIKNLEVINFSISTVFSLHDTYAAGSIAGFNCGMIIGCHTSGDILVETTYANESLETFAYAGGIVGRNNGTIQNCYNTANITLNAASTLYRDIDAAANLGGITGYNEGKIINCYNDGDLKLHISSTGEMDIVAYAGGIAGVSYGGTILNCQNFALVAVSSSSDALAGGILGYTVECGISGCNNLGSVTADSGQYAYAGGIIAQSYGGTIADCYNAGLITANSESSLECESYAGGINGASDNTDISDCYNSGNVTAVVKSINKLGEGYYPDITAFAGGISGYTSDGTIQSCNNKGTIYSEAIALEAPTVDPVTIDTDAEMSATAGGIAGCNDDGTIQSGYNYGLVTVNAVISPYDGYDVLLCVGGIAGSNEGIIRSCCNEGQVTVKSSFERDFLISYLLGGIAGSNEGDIINCYNLSDILINSIHILFVGGISGYNLGGTIYGCGNFGLISADSMNACYAGGISGRSNHGTISNCYNTENITATSKSAGLKVYAGGILGEGNGTIISGCYNVGDIAATSGDTESTNDSYEDVPAAQDDNNTWYAVLAVIIIAVLIAAAYFAIKKKN